jgi:antitoxin StbD
MPAALLADVAVSISELKKSPSAALDAGRGRPVAILNHNTPTYYAVPAALYERMLEAIDDATLNRLCDERAEEPRIPVMLDDL